MAKPPTEASPEGLRLVEEPALIPTEASPEGQRLVGHEPADFEKAILAVKWGKFHLLVYAISITAGWSSMFESTTMSYVFPAAECDLHLNLEDKGLLNAVTYAGMISTAFLWGYLSDTLGRKRLLIVGYFLDALLVMLSATSQSFTMLMVSKFFGGFVINGPYSALTAYISELHCNRHRAKAQFLLGIILSAGDFMMPLLAVNILPLDFRKEIGPQFVLHPWNLFLFVCSLAPLTSALGFSFLPESPKFLMSTGRNEEALMVFRRMYSMNTGRPAEAFPIKMLVEEFEGRIVEKRSKTAAFLEGWKQVQPLFHPPLLKRIILVCFIQGFTMNSLNTLRLWLPQLFQAVNYYEQNHNTSAPLCEVLTVLQPNETVKECVAKTSSYSVYVNSMIVATVTLLAYIAASFLINKLGKKQLFIIISTITSLSALSLYFSRTTTMILVLSAVFVAAGSVAINNMLAIIVDMFPTSLRTMTVALAMMSGRSGAVIGNSLYPVLLKSGCAAPFVYNAVLSLSCALLGLLLPTT